MYMFEQAILEPFSILTFLVGALVALAASSLAPRLLLKHKTAGPKGVGSAKTAGHQDSYAVTTVEELRRVIPAGRSGTNISNAPKVLDHLDEQMAGFIDRSPFVHVGTSGRDGLPFVSPKGDGPGFCVCEDETGKVLLIPERPGNQIIFGLQNILTNPNIGLCFQIPGNNTTLRVGGAASLSVDPHLLDKLAARGLPALVVIRVSVTYAFFHCAKAYLRSQLWKPDTWPREEYPVTFGKYFSSLTAVQKAVDQEVSLGYLQVQESVEGRCKEATGSGLVAFMRKHIAPSS